MAEIVASNPVRQPRKGQSSSEKAEAAGRSARDSLLDAAEQLFGERGIDGASLREIAAAAGQRNTGAVHYHFGDKQALADALIADRLDKIEDLRQALIAEVKDLAGCDISALLRIMWQPMLDLCEGRGGNWLIQFHLSYHIHNVGRSHPILSDPSQYPASNKLVSCLQKRASHLPLEQFRYRMGLVFVMFWVAVARHDQGVGKVDKGWSSQFSLEETVKVAVAALNAPT